MTTPPKKALKPFPAYVKVGTPLPGELKTMSGGQREDYFVNKLGEWFQCLCPKAKITDLSKAIQSELNKLYKGKTSDDQMLAFFNRKDIKAVECHIWNTVAPKFGFITHDMYVLYMAGGGV